MQRRIFGTKGNEVLGKEENRVSRFNKYLNYQKRRTKWMGHIACTGKLRNANKMLM
jgi:hypothetical protein